MNKKPKLFIASSYPCVNYKDSIIKNLSSDVYEKFEVIDIGSHANLTPEYEINMFSDGNIALELAKRIKTPNDRAIVTDLQGTITPTIARHYNLIPDKCTTESQVLGSRCSINTNVLVIPMFHVKEPMPIVDAFLEGLFYPEKAYQIKRYNTLIDPRYGLSARLKHVLLLPFRKR